jgi:hypothetical protein
MSDPKKYPDDHLGRKLANDILGLCADTRCDVVIDAILSAFAHIIALAPDDNWRREICAAIVKAMPSVAEAANKIAAKRQSTTSLAAH